VQGFLQREEVQQLLENPSAVRRMFDKMAEKGHNIKTWLRAFAFTSAA